MEKKNDKALTYRVSELKNNSNKNNQIDEVLDFSEKCENDIEEAKDFHVFGSFYYNNLLDGFTFKLHIDGKLTILSAVSLKPIKFIVDFDTDLFYTYKMADDDSFPIIGDTISLYEEVWGEIMLQVPPRVTEPGEEFDESGNIEIEKENPFSKLLEDEEEE